jgi:hypothetical protein
MGWFGPERLHSKDDCAQWGVTVPKDIEDRYHGGMR